MTITMCRTRTTVFPKLKGSGIHPDFQWEFHNDNLADKNLKGTVMSGLVRVFVERILAQLVSTVVTSILANLLTPDCYDMISIVTVL